MRIGDALRTKQTNNTWHNSSDVIIVFSFLHTKIHMDIQNINLGCQHISL